MTNTLKNILIVVLALMLVGVVIAGLLQDQTQEKELAFAIIVSAPGDFTIDMGPKNAETGEIEVRVTRGQPAVFTITTAAVDGYDGRVNLSIFGLPEGVEYSFSANDVSAGTTVTLTVQTTALTSNQVYVCNLTASPA